MIWIQVTGICFISGLFCSVKDQFSPLFPFWGFVAEKVLLFHNFNNIGPHKQNKILFLHLKCLILIPEICKPKTSYLLASLFSQMEIFRMDMSQMENNGAPGGSVNRASAPYTDAMSSPQRIRVRFHLWPFAACRSPSLSPVSCPLFSCPVLIKAQKKS